MSSALELLRALGPSLLGGASLVLALAFVATLFVREPRVQRRIGECALLLLVAWPLLPGTPQLRDDPDHSADHAADHAADDRPAERSFAAPPFDPSSSVLLAAQFRESNEGPQSSAGELGSDFSGPLGPLSVGERSTALAPAVSGPSLAQRMGAALRRTLPTAYLGFVGLALAHTLLGALLLCRLLRRAEFAPARVQECCDRLCDARSLRRVPVLVTDRPVRPFCTGLLRPRIVLPRDLAEEGSHAFLEPVLLHELAHVHHGDVRLRLAFTLARCFLGFHPLFVGLRARVHLAVEQLADDWATRRLDRHEYARRLIELAEHGWQRSGPRFGTVPVFERSTEFYRRMDMLLRRTTAPRERLGLTARGLLLTGVALTATALGQSFGLARTSAALQDEKPPTAGPSGPTVAPLGPVAGPRGPAGGDSRSTAGPSAAQDPLRAQESLPPSGGPSANTAGPSGPKNLPPPQPTLESLQQENRELRDRVQELEQMVEQLLSRSGAERGTRDAASSNPLGGGNDSVLELVRASLSARGSLKELETRIEHSRVLVERGFASAPELEADEIRLENARREYEVLQILIDGEKRALELERASIAEKVSRLEDDTAERLRCMSQLQRIESRIQALGFAQ